MNMPDHQALAAAWMQQFTDPSKWLPWFQPPQVPAGAPPGGMPQEAGPGIDHAALEALRGEYIARATALWQDFVAAKTPALADRRFSAPEWTASPLTAFHAASYLLNAEFMAKMADAVQAKPRDKQRIRFAVGQVIDAMSPANFLATNPEAQMRMIETRGESLAKGMSNMLADLQKGRISQSDESAFEVGRNVATTPGHVVFENELFQLIQYAPLTETVREVPLLIVPPCINKFYILDLQPENSVVRYALEQGNAVFLVSWRNPDRSMGHLTWDHYVEDGAIAAINVTRAIAGSDKVNAFGFCVGGTIVSTALAVLAARGEQPAASVTLLTTLLDFTDTGVLEVFVDDNHVALREQQLGQGGLLPGRELASTFSALRPNDLVWNYVQSNYLKGQEPPPFDLLYWNADSTNLPGPMFCWYLRHTYLENNLKQPGRVTVGGTPVDLGAIDAPAFIYGSREDHIVPWGAAYASMHLLNRDKPKQNRYVLGASGHIAGVINPASKNKRSYWKNDKAVRGKALPAEQWMEGATEHKGSWWPEWAAFLATHGGKEIKAPARFGNRKYKALEPAPGRYVKVRAD